MLRWLNNNISKIVFGFTLLAFLGLFFSRAILSIATVGLGISAVFQLYLNAKYLVDKPLIWALLLFGVWLSCSYFYTDPANIKNFWNELAFKLSFVSLGISLYLTVFSKNEIQILIAVFSYSAMLVAVGTFVNYLMNYEQINEMISQSKPIPVITGYFHISFSFMLGFSVLFCFWALFLSKSVSKWPKWILAVPLIVNFGLLHIIAARTGLVALYGGFFGILLCYLAIEKGKPFQSIVGMAVLVGFMVLAIAFVKPLNNRFKNTLVDINVYLNDENPNWWSGAMRLHAIENSWNIFKENPIIGVGMADLNDEVQKMFEKKGTLLLPENRINPHNQFINLLVVSGIVGFILLFLILAFALIPSLKSANWLMVGFLVMLFVGFNLESFMERQFGSCFFGIMLGMLFQPHFSRK